MKTIITALSLMCGTAIHSQSAIMRILDSDPRISTALRNNNAYDPNKNNNTISGNPYSTEDYMNGNIDKVNVNIVFKYNAYQDIIQFKDNEKIYDLPKDIIYSPIILADKTKITLEKDRNGSLHYFTELYQDNNFTLLKKYVVTLIEGKPSDGYREATSARFTTPKIEYFFKTVKGITPVPKSKKEIEKMFPDKNLELFFKQNGSFYKDEKALIKLSEILSSN